MQNETSSDGTIAIVGAGSGGLALALALAGNGLRPLVLERRSAEFIREEGLFLTLAPNGINALRAVGLAERVVAAGLPTRGIEIFNERGRAVGFVDYGSHTARFGAPSVTIRRGALAEVLLDAALKADIDLRLGCAARAVTQDENGASIETDAGPVHAAAVIACDGLRSIVRNNVFPELPAPRYSGLIGTGGFVEAPDVAPTDGVMKMTFGRRAFFGYLKADGQPVYWFDTYPAAESEGGDVADPAAFARRVAAMHADDPLDNHRIMRHVARIERAYPVYDMPELPRWSLGRVLLLGDAAHAVAPHSGQGAAMAFEDAVVLASALAAGTDLQAAFARFERLRRGRVTQAIRTGRAAGSQKHAQSWLARRIRDLILPMVMPMGARMQEKLFSFRADLTPLALP